ncbi:hypothetical protein PEC301937_39020 [Pectobacterium carotovorum subsp. carotovorum]|uniref:hypothetical protein n=1 Tax=Pectobacterium actinidiae TaxID=1507808 RepID=UPI00208B2160|nr:hypothetical protein PEC301937_39020 [Pectobacterium carotovorum subsp. carotovorum]GLW39834.1 hypothetical protein Pcaca04_37700 [Pectobacterium carotovorum subsp. carotovorum]
MPSKDTYDISDTRIVTLYWNNVDIRLVDAQRKVFEKFGFHIEQHNIHDMDHGVWMTDILDNTPDNNVVIIVDIDCIPLNAKAVEKAITSAHSGHIYGCAQSANHIDYNYVYAAPMFLALTGRTWREVGRPTLLANKEFDVGGKLTLAAQNSGYSVDLVYPTDYAVPKWLLGNSHVYGLFTIYENDYLHLFESRNQHLIECFIDIASEIISEKQSIDYRKYIIRASSESHITYLKKYIDKKSIIGKIKRELNRFKKRRLKL